MDTEKVFPLFCFKSSIDGSTWSTNKALIGRLRDAGKITCSSYNNSEAICDMMSAFADGSVRMGDQTNYCYANSNGEVICERPVEV